MIFFFCRAALFLMVCKQRANRGTDGCDRIGARIIMNGLVP